MSGILNTAIAGLSDTSEEETLRRMMEFRIAEIHTVMPAQVRQYNPERNTVDVIPALKRILINADGTETVYQPPDLVEVPVLFPRGGGYFFAWPLEPGDTVLLVFCERSINDWSISGGTGVIPDPPRKHDWSDAVAIPGVAPALQAIQGLNALDLILGQESGQTVVKISGATGTLTITAPKVELGGAGGAAVGRVGDQITIDFKNPANAAFLAWIQATAASLGAGAPFQGTLIGSIVSGSSKVDAT